MTDRRTWSIAVKFARQTDGRVTPSSFHWSPPSREWPESVIAAAVALRDSMGAALSYHNVSEDNDG